MVAMQKGAERLRAAAHITGAGGAPAELDLESYRKRMEEGLEDDLNTAPGVAALFDLARDINRVHDEGRDVSEAQALLRDLAGIMGLKLEEPAETDAGLAAKPFVDLLVDVRRELRTAKQFALADLVRDRLGELGIALEDTAQGTVWHGG
jgi:cysteinyl-tRNA synthetase